MGLMAAYGSIAETAVGVTTNVEVAAIRGNHNIAS